MFFMVMCVICVVWSIDYVYAVYMHHVSVCLYPWFCIYVFLGLSVVSVCVV